MSKNLVTDKSVADIQIPEPSFKDELIEWAEDIEIRSCTKYDGFYFDMEAFINNSDTVSDYILYYDSEVPYRIRAYFKGLVRDIEKQALDSEVTLVDPYNCCEYTDKELMERSNLPQSVVNFWKVSGVTYEFIVELVSLVHNSELAKFIFVDNRNYIQAAFSNLVVTAKYENVKKQYEMTNQWFSEWWLDGMDEIPEDYKWYKCLDLISNEIGHEFYLKYLIGE